MTEHERKDTLADLFASDETYESKAVRALELADQFGENDLAYQTALTASYTFAMLNLGEILFAAVPRLERAISRI